MSPALRIIDANLNRAREALRSAEDVARFALDDTELSKDLKVLRHSLATLAGRFPDALAHRDTPSDVGTAISTEAELRRSTLADVATAATKRLTEALRSIEEAAKTLPADAGTPPRSAVAEQLRYRAYDIEKRLVLALRRPVDRFRQVRLYVLITEKLCRRPWQETAALALEGGADALQLREPDLPSGELLKRAEQLAALCREHGKLLIINDRPDVALLAGADGVHVGQGDLPARRVREVVDNRLLVGVSTHDLAHLHAAADGGADYVGVGPVFRSTTKPRDILPGLAYARVAAEANRLPTVAIAGITPQNVADVWATGVQAIAVTAAVTMSEDPAAACARLLSR